VGAEGSTCYVLSKSWAAFLVTTQRLSSTKSLNSLFVRATLVKTAIASPHRTTTFSQSRATSSAIAGLLAAAIAFTSRM
jgi:hypothetical protein